MKPTSSTAAPECRRWRSKGRSAETRREAVVPRSLRTGRGSRPTIGPPMMPTHARSPAPDLLQPLPNSSRPDSSSSASHASHVVSQRVALQRGRSRNSSGLSSQRWPLVVRRARDFGLRLPRLWALQRHQPCSRPSKRHQNRTGISCGRVKVGLLAVARGRNGVYAVSSLWAQAVGREPWYTRETRRRPCCLRAACQEGFVPMLPRCISRCCVFVE